MQQITRGPWSLLNFLKIETPTNPHLPAGPDEGGNVRHDRKGQFHNPNPIHDGNHTPRRSSCLSLSVQRPGWNDGNIFDSQKHREAQEVYFFNGKTMEWLLTQIRKPVWEQGSQKCSIISTARSMLIWHSNLGYFAWPRPWKIQYWKSGKGHFVHKAIIGWCGTQGSGGWGIYTRGPLFRCDVLT